MKKKKYLLLLAMSVCALSLAACGKKDEAPKTDTTVVKEETVVNTDDETATPTPSIEVEAEDPYADNEYAKYAVEFAETIKAKDFDKALSMLKIDSPDFVTADDVERGIYSTSIKDLIGGVGDLTVENVSEDYKKATVTISFGDQSYLFVVLENEDGSYSMPTDGICINDYVITAPRGINVTLDGKDISEYLTTSSGDVSTYTIPQVGYGDKSAVMSLEGFDDVTVNITPTTEGYELFYSITDEDQLNTYYEAYKNLMNGLFKDTFGNVNAETLKPYFYANATGDDIQAVVGLLTTEKGFSSRVFDSGKVPAISYVDGNSAHATEKSNFPDVRVLNGETGAIRMNLAVSKDYSRKDGYVSDEAINLFVTADVVYEDGEMKLMPIFTGRESFTDIFTEWPMSPRNEWN